MTTGPECARLPVASPEESPHADAHELAEARSEIRRHHELIERMRQAMMQMSDVIEWQDRGIDDTLQREVRDLLLRTVG